MSVLSGRCPNCKNPLAYNSGESSVYCEWCDTTVNVADLSSGKSYSTEAQQSAKFGGGMSAMMPAMMGFDNPESGVVFVENFFDNYDWDEYQRHSDVYIDELNEVVATNKMKNGAVATSWYLDYKSVAVPLRKKIEGLANIAEEVGSAYNPDDDTEMLQYYDSYNNICKALLAEKSVMFARFENSIKYAEKFALDKARLDEMKKDFADLGKLFEKEVKFVDDVSKFPAYVAAQKAFDKAKLKEFSDNGIDAKAIYEEAVEKFNTPNSNKNALLSMFESTRGYKDSVKFINLINRYYSFNGELYYCFGKYFVFKSEATAPTALNVKDLKAAVQTQPSSKTLAMHEVVNGEPAKDPMVTGIVQIIACYGSKIFYLKDHMGVCSYDVQKKMETTVCAGTMEEYRIGKSFRYGLINKGKSFYIQKKFVPKVDNSGCGSKKKEAPAPVETNDNVSGNPYSIVVVDMVQNNSKMVVTALSEVLKRSEDTLFYIFIDQQVQTSTTGSGCSAQTQKSVVPKSVFMACDLKTGKSKQVLDEDCMVEAVSKNKIVYTHYEPCALNRNLYVYDLDTSENKLIEKNIYSFFDVVADKIYYLVGNEDYCPLMRNSFAGDAREEIMQNVENIICVKGDWLYVKKGRRNSLNSAIIKVSADGKKRVPLCTQYKSNAEIYGNFVYYVDIFNALRCVRIDGKKNVCIAENVFHVWPTNDCLYYVRQENVGQKDKSLSLYKMDKTGHNIRKLAFDVNVVDYDSVTNTLYYKKAVSSIFKVYKPGHEKEATRQVFPLQKFYKMDMVTEETKLVLTLGLPHSVETKSGCGGKKTEVDTIYEQIPFEHSYALERAKKEIEEGGEEKEPVIVAPANAGCGSTPAPAVNNSSANAGCGGAPAAKNASPAKSGCGA